MDKYGLSISTCFHTWTFRCKYNKEKVSLNKTKLSINMTSVTDSLAVQQ